MDINTKVTIPDVWVLSMAPVRKGRPSGRNTEAAAAAAAAVEPAGRHTMTAAVVASAAVAGTDTGTVAAAAADTIGVRRWLRW